MTEQNQRRHRQQDTVFMKLTLFIGCHIFGCWDEFKRKIGA